ncbi:2-methylcitrate dehydratase [Aspergillus japonicus CBS 114.51]|uniref:2-methylcitrate dehydratase n=1 Tax=Aspergillus japonicus CBS 114.51 TaxID=1448312 RepID=A0A8T8WL82_ASPJA|nr:2-methylcitrate dehydratase [Aspergillus japonicus CBS 114.51]RAH76536.1 2-methylcitrate dehydratase [Aspergillus japonicus CBS 114.51]
MGDQGTGYDQLLVSIVRYVYHEKIESPYAYRRARVALLDAFGCAIESLHLSQDCRDLVGPVAAGTVVPGGFRLPGTSHVLDPVKGAFDFGSLIRYLDHNDAYPGAEWGHPSDNLGAIVAVADWLSQTRGSERRVSLRTVLTAQIKAYEIQGVLQQKNAFNAHGLDHTLLVKIASTAVTSWLLGLPEEAALAVLSHAWIDGHPLRTFRQSPNAGPRKGWAAGDACMRAVHLALIGRRSRDRVDKAGRWQGGAAAGLPSALTAPKWGFRDTLFGGGEIVQSRPFESAVMESVFFKLITAEGHGISAVEAAVEVAAVLKARNLRAERDVRAVRIRTQGPAMTIINKEGPLRNPADRDHCLQYMVAVVLLKGAVIETADYLDSSPWASDERVDALRAKMTVVEDPKFTADYYDPKVRTGANAITVELDDGRVLDEVVVEYPVGHPRRPDTLDKVLEKFRVNMGTAFDEQETEKIVRSVEDDELAIEDFVALFVR